MKHSEDIVVKLLQIKYANRLVKSGKMSGENIEKLEDFVARTRQQVAPLALSHFDRLENSGACGVAEVVDGKCSHCGAKIAPDELEYLKNNIGVCENCFAFTYIADSKFDVEAFFKDFLSYNI